MKNQEKKPQNIWKMKLINPINNICWTRTKLWQDKHSFKEQLPKLITYYTIKQTVYFKDCNYSKWILLQDGYYGQFQSFAKS